MSSIAVLSRMFDEFEAKGSVKAGTLIEDETEFILEIPYDSSLTNPLSTLYLAPLMEGVTLEQSVFTFEEGKSLFVKGVIIRSAFLWNTPYDVNTMKMRFFKDRRIQMTEKIILCPIEVCFEEDRILHYSVSFRVQYPSRRF